MPVISQARCPSLKDSLTRHPVSVVSKKGSLTHFSSMYRFTCIFSASSQADRLCLVQLLQARRKTEDPLAVTGSC